jgi:phage recombination protein Bet
MRCSPSALRITRPDFPGVLPSGGTVEQSNNETTKDVMNGQQNQQLTKIPSEERELEFLPFGGDTKIRLSIAMIQKYIAKKTRAGHTCSVGDAMNFMMMCHARALSPWEGDAFLIGYDSQDGPVFSIVTAHQAFLKRAEVNPEYDGMQSGVVVRTADGKLEEHEGDFVDEGETLLGGWAKVHFRNRKYPIYRKLHINNFIPERPSPLWRKNAAGMICKTAEADALRSAFPTKCGGMYLQQEIDTTASLGTPQLPARVPESATVAALTAGNGSHQPMPTFNAEPEKVPVESAQPELVPQPRQTTPEASPQEKLRVLVEQEGFEWEVFSLWAQGKGHIPEGSKWVSFAELPDDVAKRILRINREILRTGLAGAKGVVQ